MVPFLSSIGEDYNSLGKINPQNKFLTFELLSSESDTSDSPAFPSLSQAAIASAILGEVKGG